MGDDSWQKDAAGTLACELGQGDYYKQQALAAKIRTLVNARVVELEAALKVSESNVATLTEQRNFLSSKYTKWMERAMAAEAELRRTDPNYTPLLDKYAADIQSYADRAEAAETRATAAEAALREIDKVIHANAGMTTLVDGLDLSALIRRVLADRPREGTQE